MRPAAVALHATYSGYADDVSAIHLAPDGEAERQLLPEPGSLTGCLFLAHGGSPSVADFLAIRVHGGASIIRLSTSHDPYVTAARQKGRRVPLAPPTRSSRCLVQRTGAPVDVDIEDRHADHADRFCVEVAPGRAGHTSRLCTNRALSGLGGGAHGV